MGRERPVRGAPRDGGKHGDKDYPFSHRGNKRTPVRLSYEGSHVSQAAQNSG